MLFEDTIMGLWGSIGVMQGFGVSEMKTKTKNFDKYKSEIEKTRVYIKSQRKAFYKNNNLKER